MTTTQYTIHTTLQNDYTITVLADLHSKVPKGLLKQVQDATPDLIVLPGDCIDGTTADAPDMLPFLASLAKIAPTFYADGNHDLFQDEDITAVEKTGVVFLKDQTTQYQELTIGGLASGFSFGKQGHFAKTPPPNLDYLKAFASEGGFKFLLCHHPEYYTPYLKDLPIDLVVSGHAHGGQWRFFGRGVFAPGQGIFPRYTAGLHDNRFVISRGIGSHTIVPRIFNTPELVIITLKSETNKKDA